MASSIAYASSKLTNPKSCKEEEGRRGIRKQFERERVKGERVSK